MSHKLTGVVPAAALAAGLFICVGCQNQDVLRERHYQETADSEVAGTVAAPVDINAPIQQEEQVVEELVIIEEETVAIQEPVVVAQKPPVAPEKPKYKPFVGKTNKPINDRKTTAVATSNAKAGNNTYVVKKGDVLSKIAYAHGVKTVDLAAVNKISVNATLQIGQKLVIPAGGKSTATATTSASTNNKATSTSTVQRPSDGIYTVQSNDSLWLIARRFDTTVKTLCELNNISSNKPLQLGQKIKLPGATGSVAPVKTAEKPAETVKPVTVTTPPVTAPTELSVSADTTNSGTITPIGSTEIINPVVVEEPQVVTPVVTEVVEVKTQSTMINQDMTLENFCRAFRWQEDEIRRLNPNIPADGMLKAKQTIIVPAQ